LSAWGDGDRTALERLLPLVYAELHRIAERSLRQMNRGVTLQPTALINEAFVKLIGQDRAQWQNREQFFGVAANMMRRLLLDYARKHQTIKRGSGGTKFPLDDALEISDEKAAELIALDDALLSLEKIDPAKSRIVELRYFGGLTVEETAHVLDVSIATIVRQWRAARLWLFRELNKGDADGQTEVETD
jgi:RNA polymerase sigma factor (TIGR02999 family)